MEESAAFQRTCLIAEPQQILFLGISLHILACAFVW